MSSLKDWYRYVDSRARNRPESGGPPERERAADDPNAPPAAAGTEAEEPEAEAPAAELAPGEEGLDVWSGLFPQRPKPDLTPATGPLRRAAPGPDEAPADLTFAQAPIETPPAPSFPLPETQVEIPSFDEFVSPFTPEPPPAAAPAPAPPPPASERAPGGAAPAETSAAPPETRAAEPAPPITPTAPASPESAAPGRAPEDQAAGVPEGQPVVAQAFMPGKEGTTPASPGAPGAWTAESTPGPPPPHGAPKAAAASTGAAPESAMPASPPETPPPAGDTLGAPSTAATDETPDEDLAPWRSPFQRPGPGRTVSSGAAPPFPEPSAPRVQAARSASLEAALSTVEEQAIERTEPQAPAAERPIPGTPEWERERVERLARTFRETLQVLEQSRAGVPVEEPVAEDEPVTPTATLESGTVTPAPSAPAAFVAPSPAAPAPAAPGPPVAEVESALPVAPLQVPAPLSQPPPPPIEEAEAVTAETLTPPAPAPSIEPQLSPQAPAAPDAREVESPALLPPDTGHRRPKTEHRTPVAATPDVRQSIEEAALMRERLPQHIDMLLRIPTNEVAQNSYKSPFRETREDLVRRLLDPQLTLEEAARVLGVCPTTVRRYTNRGMLHCHRTPGNQRRFRMSDVLQFLEQYGDRIDRAAEARQMEEAA